jgi:hypothetical protein
MPLNGYQSSEVSTGTSFDGDLDDDESSFFEEEEEEENPEKDTEGIDDDFEDKAVSCFRLFVLFILVSAMAAAGISTWHFISNDQADDFQHEVRLSRKLMVEIHQCIFSFIISFCEILFVNEKVYYRF